jgi:multicomponent Na+:H+ antiporter subunit F
MTVFISLAVAGLVIAASCAGYRLVTGPAAIDRVIAIDVLLVVVAAAVAVRIAGSGSGDAIDILIYVALLSFTGTIIAARFVERGGGPG